MASRRVTVTVDDRPYEITLDHPSKTVWVAIGDYMGVRIEVKRPSPTAAVNAWVAAAGYGDN